MSDPIQSSSSIPVPRHQTIAGANDRTVVSSNRARETDARVASDTERDNRTAGFQDYLNTQSITTVEKRQSASNVYDPAAEIAAGSVYGGAGQRNPI